jgi:hypothetical protein
MKVRALMLATLCAASVSPAIAGTQTGFVKDIYIRESDGLILVDLFGTASGHPVCAQQPYWVIPNESSETDKRLLALLLAAQLSSRYVTIIGTDTCSRWPDGEDIGTVGMAGQQP